MNVGESKKWAPASWSADKVRLFVEHVRKHLMRLPWETDPKYGASYMAVKDIDLARSKLAILRKYGLDTLYQFYPEEKPAEKTDGSR